MAYAGARLIAAAFQSGGLAATVSPASDARTLELGGLHSSGEECLPHKVTLGDFLKVCEQPGFDPKKAAFFMATAHGPCRFGQYAPYLKRELEQLGYGDAIVFSPSSDNGYEGFGEHATEMMQTAWMALVCGDLATKFLLKTRPYENRAGDADAAFDAAISDFQKILSKRGIRPRQRIGELSEAVVRVRDRFRAVPARYEKGRPMIGLVGEIFCRLNNFSNDETARRVERLGGECWISDIAEWVWYTNWTQGSKILLNQGWLNTDYLKFKIKTHIQRSQEHALLESLREDFKGYEEPHDVAEVLELSRPYLPPEGCLGEMVLSVGKSIYLQHKGADGIIDISPFTCMNGIICEAVYPAVSSQHDDMPIRMLYFDGTNTNTDRDVEIFLDLARAYQKRKRYERVYPDYFRG